MSGRSWGFLFRFGKVAYSLGWLPSLIISIQPFAYVVGNYTRHNRNDKRYESIYKSTPPFPACIGVATVIVYHRLTKLYKVYKVKQLIWKTIA